MDAEKLKSEIPKVAETLALMMVRDAIPFLQNSGMSLDVASPAVSISYSPSDGGPKIKISLSIKTDDEDLEDEDLEDDLPDDEYQ